MYKQFCKNLRTFIEINEEENNIRLKIAEQLLPLTDIESYKLYKGKNDIKYIKTSNLIYSLSRYSKTYSSFNRFIWELWAYGFDSIAPEQSSENNDILVDEKAKLVDLLLGTHYFS